jgi:hypothetical protein
MNEMKKKKKRKTKKFVILGFKDAVRFISERIAEDKALYRPLYLSPETRAKARFRQRFAQS